MLYFGNFAPPKYEQNNSKCLKTQILFCKNYNRKITWCRKTAKYLDALYFLFGDRDLKCRKPKLMNIR